MVSKTKIGGFFGLLSVIVGITGDLIAMSLYPGYNFIDNHISNLGTGPGGIFFNVGVILAGLIAVPYVIQLGKALQKENEDNNLILIGIVTSIISSITLSLIGIVPAYLDNPPMSFIHGIIAAICYTGAVIYLIIYGRLMMNDERFLNGFSYLAFINGVFFILLLFTWLPLIQWIANIFIIIWTTMIASYMLYKKL